MGRYRSKPSEIEAVQWTGDNFVELEAFAHGKVGAIGDQLSLRAGKDGAQDWVPVPVGHWIVNMPGDKSHFWPVDPEYFTNKYESGQSVARLSAAEHFEQAEELDAKAQQVWDEQIVPNAAVLVQGEQAAAALAVCDWLTRRAQVHATLATVRSQPEPPERETITGWLYCSCAYPRGSRQTIATNPECPVHGEET